MVMDSMKKTLNRLRNMVVSIKFLWDVRGWVGLCT